MIKKYTPYIIVFYVLAVVAMAVGSFCDLQIDIALNDPENAFAIWFRNTGEIPARLVLPLAGTVLFYTAEHKWSKFVSAVVCLGGSAYLGYYLGKYFFIDDDNRLIFSILFGVGIGIVFMLIGSQVKLSKKVFGALKVLAIVGIVVMCLELGIVELLKYFWGRVRFRDLLAAGSYDEFTNWFVVNGATGDKSFPSGHTASAAVSYLLMLVPFVKNKYGAKKYTPVLFFVPFVYTSVVAFTRLVMGAHYLTDVTVGGIITFTLVIVSIALLDSEKCGKKISNAIMKL